MKKTRWKNILRSIRQSLNRFLSIMFIVALGAGFMAGLAAASPDMYEAADHYIDIYSLFDIDIKSLTGILEEDLESLRNVENVAQIQGARIFDMVLKQEGGSDFTSRVYGIFDENGQTQLNHINLMEGRLPQKAGECVAESVFGRYTGESVSIGDTLVLASENQDHETLEQYMTQTELTVVGICQSPMCISIEGDPTNIGSGTINLNIYVLEDLFDCGYYTDLYVSLNNSESYDTFSTEYDEYVDSVIERIKPLGKSLSEARIRELTQELNDRADVLEQLINSFSGIEEIERELEKAQEKGQADLNAFSAGAFADEDAQEDQHEGSLKEIIERTEILAQDSAQNYSPAGDLLQQADDALSKLRTTIDDLGTVNWIYRTRNDQAGFESYKNNVGKVSALAKIFPVFFFVVALLVALTTMSRLIEEKRLQIGTLKAMGFSNANVLFEFMMFSLLASVIGCILGFGIGFRVFPVAINSAYSMMYFLPQMQTPVRWDIVSWVAPVTVGSIALAALWSCWNEFRSMPAALMTPRTPAAGKRIWLEHIGFIWKRLSFTYKVTFRNLFRYKKRFIMTIIGVAGCSALLLTGFGIRDSVNEIVNKQFGEIYLYDSVFAVDKRSSVDQDPGLSSILEDKTQVTSYMTACQETGKIHVGRNSDELTLFVPEDTGKMQEFITLRDRKSGERYTLENDSIILTEKLCEELKIKRGDTVILENSSGNSREVRVQAITENYVVSFAYMTGDLYKELFGTEPEYTSLMCFSEHDMTAKLLESQHILYGRSVTSLKESFADSIQSINGVIYILILAAGLLCIVVLYNLTNVNICERRKELATLNVLGFFKNETQNYIFRETNILSLLGSLAGLLVGIWLHGFVVRTVEVNNIMFGREIKPLSYIIALAISMIFTLIVNLIMKRPINHTDMVEAMKAND